MKKRKRFTREFKLEAVRLLEEGQKPAADLARELGIRRNQLYKWKEQITNKGPFEYWPTGYGFEYFYGFLAGEASQYEPTLVRNTASSS